MNLRNSIIKRLGPYVFPLRVRHVHGPTRLALDPQDLVVLTLARDSARYMRSFIDHHLRLGARHIVVLDNGSTDQSLDIASSYERVTVLRTRASFKYHEYIMRRYLIRRFAGQRWCLYVDIDELFDYPYSDRLPLQGLLGYLNQQRYTAVVGLMLDMFPNRPLRPQPENDQDLLREYPLYDLSAIESKPFPEDEGNVRANPAITRLFGGIRKTFLGVNVLLSKHPLMFNDGVLVPFAGRAARAHNVGAARVADISCLLLHYKLVDGFYNQAAKAAQTEHYSINDNKDYKTYLKALDTGSGARNPAGETAQEFTGVNQLVEQGFLQVSPAYEQWVREYAGNQ